MKKFISTLVVGLFLVYFIDAAFQVDGLTKEMLVDNFFRFLLGFIMMGLWSWSEHKHKSKIFMYLLLALVLGDIMFDYMQKISSFDLEMTLHDLYFFFWGALSGYFFHNTFIEKE